MGDSCFCGVCALAVGPPEQRIEKLLRRALPHLADSRLDISQLGPSGHHPSASSSEAAFRVEVDEGKEVLFARLARELRESCRARCIRLYYGFEPLYTRRQDAMHMRQLLASVGISPKALKADGPLTIDLFMQGGSLNSVDICDWPEVYWPRLGKLLGTIHRCCLDGFEVNTPAWPDRMRWLASLVQEAGGTPPMHEIRDVMSHWPTKGVAAALVPSHGDFAGSSILKDDKDDTRLLATDFEYSGLNFAGIDVSYLFFSGLAAQGHSEPVMSGGEPNWKCYPALRHREKFARAYLEFSGNLGEEEPQTFLLEAERYAPAVGLWAGMSLARNPATRRGSTWYLSGYSAACLALQADRQRLLNEGAWSIACAASARPGL